MWRKPLFLGLAAGVMIGMGGSVYLAMCGTNPVVGAVLFSVALYSICAMGLWLYTGKIGFLVESHKKADLLALPVGLLGNVIGAAAVAGLGFLCRSDFADIARTICEKKLDKSALSVLAASMLCGVLMYTAVVIYRDNRTPLGVFFAIPVFILSGFEHSVADLFYFCMSGLLFESTAGRSLLFLLLAVVGNSVGAWIVPLLRKLAADKPGTTA